MGVIIILCGLASIILHLMERNTDTDQYLPTTAPNNVPSAEREYDGFTTKQRKSSSGGSIKKDELELDDYTPPQLW